MANRLITINIRKYLVKQPRRKRPMRISTYLKYRIAKSTNIRSDNIRISKELNVIVMKKYINSMKPLKVSISIDKDITTVTPFEQKAAAKAQEAKPQKDAAAKAQPKGPAMPSAKPETKKGSGAADLKKSDTKQTKS
ncbi:MAG: hypothetical protein KGI06_00815 [Candidatus Micrarchaeota archaeon]|nr:hypothetical protein [Candidatus Micrarchaeota archaeon]